MLRGGARLKTGTSSAAPVSRAVASRCSSAAFAPGRQSAPGGSRGTRAARSSARRSSCSWAPCARMCRSAPRSPDPGLKERPSRADRETVPSLLRFVLAVVVLLTLLVPGPRTLHGQHTDSLRDRAGRRRSPQAGEAQAEGSAAARGRRPGAERSALARLVVAREGSRSGRVARDEGDGGCRRRRARHRHRPQPPRSSGRLRRRLGRRQRGRRRQRRPRPRHARRRRDRRPREQRHRRRRSLLAVLADAGQGDRRQRCGQRRRLAEGIRGLPTTALA